MQENTLCFAGKRGMRLFTGFPEMKRIPALRQGGAGFLRVQKHGPPQAGGGAGFLRRQKHAPPPSISAKVQFAAKRGVFDVERKNP